MNMPLHKAHTKKERSMFLRNSRTGDLILPTEPGAVFNPCVDAIKARSLTGKNATEIGSYKKSALLFPSGEPLPLCWRDRRYREPAACSR
jgi:hypothetical protein